MNVQFKKGVLELLVLHLLSLKDFYGYELVDRISQKISISEGTIYPLLRRFKKEGYVLTYLQESESGPPRKYYQLTPRGKLEVESQRKEWESFVRGVEEILGGQE